MKVLAFDTNNLLLFLAGNESSPLGISFMAVALDFHVFLAQTILLKEPNGKHSSCCSQLGHKLKEPTKRRNDVLSQSEASSFAAGPN